MWPSFGKAAGFKEKMHVKKKKIMQVSRGRVVQIYLRIELLLQFRPPVETISRLESSQRKAKLVCDLMQRLYTKQTKISKIDLQCPLFNHSCRSIYLE